MSRTDKKTIGVGPANQLGWKELIEKKVGEKLNQQTKAIEAKL